MKFEFVYTTEQVEPEELKGHSHIILESGNTNSDIQQIKSGHL